MTTSSPDPRLARLVQLGQAPWLDSISRDWLHSGKLAELRDAYALRGVTSNPSIFQAALRSSIYDADVRALAEAGMSDRAIFHRLATDDIRDACDIMLEVHRSFDDGYVSLEVSPDLARDAAGTVAEARRLWQIVDRPNLMIKVPGTPEGADAVKQLIADGINVNVTLLFAIEAHARVIDAYLDGLEQGAAAGLPIDRIASVASFFVSRVDSAIDKQLETMAIADESQSLALRALQGKAAIANAKLAYRLFTASFSGPRWAALAARGTSR